jgi:exodeoxyribonuclease VII small subunit
MKKTAENEFKFEESLKKLEDIVTKLESGELSLDESLKLFEEGTKLSKELSNALDKAEQQIVKLTEKDKPAEKDG